MEWMLLIRLIYNADRGGYSMPQYLNCGLVEAREGSIFPEVCSVSVSGRICFT